MIDIKTYIINKSKELNIDIIGFTDCEALLGIKDYLIIKKKMINILNLKKKI